MNLGRRGARRPARRQTKRAILLVTNGRVTERQYLNEVAQRANTSTQRVKVQVIDKEPVTMLKELRSPKGDVSGYDEIWLVIDADGHDRSSIIRACRKRSTKHQRWDCVVSRPCFEVWLVAHYEPVRNYSDQRDAQRHLAELTGRRVDDKRLPTGFPFDDMGHASKRCVLPGGESGGGHNGGQRHAASARILGRHCRRPVMMPSRLRVDRCP